MFYDFSLVLHIIVKNIQYNYFTHIDGLFIEKMRK